MTTVETRPTWRKRRTTQSPRFTPKQLVFIQAVAAGNNYTEAARQAGYKDGPALSHTASLLVAKPAISDAITRARSLVVATKQWTIEWWRTELAAAHTAAVNADDIPSRLRALELAGRHLGALESRADTASAELSARLTQHLVQAMAIQMATAQVDAPATVEGEIRRVFPNASFPTPETAVSEKP